MRRILRRIVLVVYLFTVIPTAGAILSQWISPSLAWPLAFFGLLFPLIILIQLLFVIIFILFRSKAVVLPVLMILASWAPLAHTIQISGSNKEQAVPENQVRVMTYNVRLFDFFKWSGLKNVPENILSYIKADHPDILCLQEFLIQDPGILPLSRIKSELSFLPYSYIEYNYIAQSRKHGVAIFSRYPLVNAGHEHFPDTRNLVIYADVKIGNDTIRLYNGHLESIHFDRDQFNLIDDKSDTSRLTRDKISDMIGRMKGAFKKRAEQAIVVRRNIDQSPYPVVVCGDFNDTPVSFAVHKIRNGLSDSFRSGGKGMGITFPNMRAPLRIDYILHSKEIVSSGYKIGRIDYSDHRPVSCWMRID